MGIKKMITRAADRAAGGVSKMASLSQAELESIALQQEIYLSQIPDPNDTVAEEMTRRLLAAGSVKIFNAYLDQLKELYIPAQHTVEYNGAAFDAARNIRFFNITRWATDRNEKSLEKLVNVYQVLSNENCNIGLIFHRTETLTNVWLAVTNTDNADNNVEVNIFRDRLKEAVRGNFPGAELDDSKGVGRIPCLNNETPFSVAVASNIPTEKSEGFVSQTIEKLLDGIVPDSREKEYIIILLATPVRDVEERKLQLAQLYSALMPYAEWTMSFTYNESSSTGAAATVGVNIGVSAGIQNGTNQTYSTSTGTTDSTSDTATDSVSEGTSETAGTSITESSSDTATDTVGSSTSSAVGNTQTTGTSYTEGTSTSTTDASSTYQSTTAGVNVGVSTSFTSGINVGSIVSNTTGVEVGASLSTTGGSSESLSATAGSSITSGTSTTSASSLTKSVGESVSSSTAKTVGKAVASTATKAVSSTVGRSVASTLGKAVSSTVSTASGAFKSFSLGGNFGASFARTSSITAVIGKSEGITQSFTNYNIKHALELLESQMKRLEHSTAMGLWDFAAYFLSEDQAVANNVAHTYQALTQGEESYLSQASVNLWRGDRTDSGDAREICCYLRDLRHPVFGLNPDIIRADPDYQLYPAVVTATTELTGKELARSLNFPQHSVPGLPVMECTAFGRNVITYGPEDPSEKRIHLGQIFHMNRTEGTPVDLTLQSLVSHTFITGSTGTGKSNAVYQLISRTAEHGVRFLVIEPAKGEYKNVFQNEAGVSVYGTNPSLTPLLRINPFRFPKEIHILEHLDRLVEIFNACWPMYAAMPAVLKSAMERAYSDCGWDLYRSVNALDPELYPTFSDVAHNIRGIINESEYDAENKGAYKGSLLTRLQSLTNGINGMIFTCDDIADADLFDRNVIIDLSRVGSTETKALLMGLLVLKLQEHRMSSAGMNEHIRHITVLEEAHSLLRRTSEQGVENANLQSKSVELLANAIAEMRTYGEGFVIADQAPGLLDPAVIRNTNTKIILRLPDQEDRELVGGAAALHPDQIRALAQIPRGVAAVYQNEWMQPVLCKIDRYAAGDARYVPTPETRHFNPDPEGKQAARELLDALLQQELYSRNNQAADRRIRETILRSRLDGEIKKDLLRYLQMDGEKEDRFPVLSRLVYRLTNAESAIASAEHCRTPEAWQEAVTAALHPGLYGYSQKQIDTVLGLILCEQSLRDPTYENLLVRYTELHQEKKEAY